MVVKIVVKNSGIAGKGLFANQDVTHNRLKKDRTVVVQFDGAKMSQKKWDKYWKEKKLPSDSAIGFYDYVLYDPKFVSMRSPPKWYRLNHSFSPNLEVSKKGEIVRWTTLKDIKKGDELTFHYGDPDPDWS